MKIKTLIKAIILLAIIVVLGCGINNYIRYNILYPSTYYDKVSDCASKYNIDPYLIMAVIKAESNFKPEAVSNKGAIGLMQITPSTAAWAAEQMGLEGFNSSDLKTPEINIRIGVWYINYLLNYYHGDTKLALAAYNAGTGTVDKWISEETIKEQNGTLTLPYKETSDYLKKIDRYHTDYKQLYANGKKPWWKF